MYIETPRLILRPFTLDDANDYFNIVQDELIHKYVPFSFLETIDETYAAIKKCYAKSDFLHDFYLLIVEKKSNTIIGAIMITENYHKKYHDFCYFIVEKYRRNGYMKEALEAFLNNFSLKDKKLMFIINPTNTASLNLIKQIEGVKPVYPDIILRQGRYKQFCYQT